MVTKREILSIKKSNVPDKNNTIIKSDNTNKQSSTVKAPLNSLAEILSDIFIVEIKKDGKPKPIKIGREHETALKRLEVMDLKDHKLVDDLIANIKSYDPSYKHLLELVVLSRGAQAKVRRALIEVAVLVVSRNWLGRLSGSDNIFVDYASPVGINNPNVVAVICENIKAYFEHQQNQRKKYISESSDQNTQPDTDFKVSSADLKKRTANVVAIACLWALETGKCSAEKAITQMQQVLLPDSKLPANVDTGICYAFASSIRAPIDELNSAIYYFEQKLEVNEERRKHAERIEQSKNAELKSSRSKLADLKITVEVKDAEINALKTELASLQEESHKRQLSEQASRVHLRDDAGKVKSKAYNLLSEDVEPAMQLSLRALMRENPKVEVAIHQIELALESIEGSLSWFK